MFQDNADPVLLGEHDVALASIEKIVAGKDGVSSLRTSELNCLYRNTPNMTVCNPLPQQFPSPCLYDLHGSSVQFLFLET